jgi:hypothetical protein
MVLMIVLLLGLLAFGCLNVYKVLYKRKKGRMWLITTFYIIALTDIVVTIGTVATQGI